MLDLKLDCNTRTSSTQTESSIFDVPCDTAALCPKVTKYWDDLRKGKSMWMGGRWKCVTKPAGHFLSPAGLSQLLLHMTLLLIIDWIAACHSVFYNF